MSKGNEFRQYAEEALGWAREAKSEKEKETLTGLADIWMRAALQSEHILFANSNPPQPHGQVSPLQSRPYARSERDDFIKAGFPAEPSCRY